MRSNWVSVTALVVLASPGISHAQAAPAPQAAPVQAAPVYDPYAPPAPQGAPPPPPYYAPPPYGYPPYGMPPNGMQLMTYQSNKREPGIALVIELFVPGVGSIYGDHIPGALVTWGGTILGFVLLVHGVEQDVNTLNGPNGNDSTNSSGDGFILAGALIMIGARIYGLVDAYSSTKSYNAALAQRLGLPPDMMTLAPMPITTPRAVSWGPALTLRF